MKKKRILALAAFGAVLALTDPAQATLIAHYSFDTDGTATVGSNATLNANATISTTEAAVGAGALHLGVPNPDAATGSSDGAVSENSFALTNTARSVNFWMKAEAAQDTNPTMISLGAGSSAGNRFDIRMTGGNLRLEVQSGGSTTAVNVGNGNWYNVTVVCGDQVRVSNCLYYVYDTTANLVGSGAFTGSGTAIATGTGPLRMGDSYQDTARDFYGYLDEVRLYDNELTQADALALAQLWSPPSTPASVTMQPVDQTLTLGSTNPVTFSITAAGFPTPTYQWKKDGVNIPDATNSTLVLAAVTPSDIADYSVGVTNIGGGEVSSSASLTFSLPSLSPPGLSRFPGESAAFSITMPAYQTYDYQWKHAGTNLPGATASQLTLSAIGSADAGAYTLEVTWSGVTLESDAVPLVVLTAPTQSFSQIVSNDAPVAWWRLNEPAGTYSATDVIGYRSASATYGDYYGDVAWAQEGALLGDSDTAAAFTGYSAGGRAGYAKLDTFYDATLNPSVFSVEFWAMLTGSQAATRSPLTSRNVSTGVAKGYSFYVGSGGAWQFFVYDGTGSTAIIGPAASLNEWAHIVGTYDGTTMRLYVNGVLVGSATAAYIPNDLYGLRIGAGATESASGSFYWPGRLDEVAIYDHVLSDTQVGNHYAAAFPTTAAPRLTLQPRSLATIAGETVSLNAKAHSTPPLSFQWKHAGTNVPGATNATLELNAAAAADGGSYQAVVTHGAASVNSSVATLSVLPGQAVSVSIKGFEDSRTIAANGGVAGYVAVPNWNEVGYNANSGSASGLVNHKGQPSPITVDWQADNNRRWNGPYGSAAADYALLNSQIEGTNSLLVTVSNIPSSFQSAGYSVYVYLGAPHATAGLVDPNTWSGAVSIGTSSNYYHAVDLATWDGSWLQATTTDPNEVSPSNANYAVFSGLSGDTALVTVGLHPLGLTGPVTLSGIQIVANVAPVASNPTNLTWSVIGNQLNVAWPGDHLGWTLQTQTNLLSVGLGANWVDVPGSTSVTNMAFPIAPGEPAVFFRLKQ